MSSRQQQRELGTPIVDFSQRNDEIDIIETDESELDSDDELNDFEDTSDRLDSARGSGRREGHEPVAVQAVGHRAARRSPCGVARRG